MAIVQIPTFFVDRFYLFRLEAKLRRKDATNWINRRSWYTPRIILKLARISTKKKWPFRWEKKWCKWIRNDDHCTNKNRIHFILMGKKCKQRKNKTYKSDANKMSFISRKQKQNNYEITFLIRGYPGDALANAISFT